MDPDSGGSKTCGSGGSGSTTLARTIKHPTQRAAGCDPGTPLTPDPIRIRIQNDDYVTSGGASASSLDPSHWLRIRIQKDDYKKTSGGASSSSLDPSHWSGSGSKKMTIKNLLPREALRRVPWNRPTQRAAGCGPLFPDPQGRPGHPQSPGCTSQSYNKVTLCCGQLAEMSAT